MKRPLLAGLVAVLLGFGVSAPAAAAPLSAEDREEGLWYASVLKLDEIHGQGITGEGVTIAVIDTGINTQAAELEGANITLKGRWCVDDDGNAPPVDTSDPGIASHGTAVVAAIVGSGVAGDGGAGMRGVAPDAEILFYGGSIPAGVVDGWECSTLRPPDGVELEDELGKYSSGETSIAALAAMDAIRSGADIINVSGSYSGESSWIAAMAEAIREGVIIVGAATNPSEDEPADAQAFGGEVSFPASLNGAVAVNAFDKSAESVGGSDAGGEPNLAVGAPGVDVLLPGSSFYAPTLGYGTSFATPMVSGVIALALDKHPNASGHQVLQAMIRTTGNLGFREDPNWVSPTVGYGLVGPRALLEADIAQMPEENPLFVIDPSDPRCAGPDGWQPTTIAFCTSWATVPGPEDVWPDEYSPDEVDPEDEPAQDPDALGADDAPTESDEADDVNTSPTQPDGAGLSVGVILGLGILVFLIAIGGVMVMVRRSRSE